MRAGRRGEPKKIRRGFDMGQVEEGCDEAPGWEEVAAVDRWIDEGNPNAWDAEISWSEKMPRRQIRRGKNTTAPALAEHVVAPGPGKLR